MGTEETYRWAVSREARTGERVVLTCTECGGKYRPAGGPCIHEQTTNLWQQGIREASQRFAAGVQASAAVDQEYSITACGLCGMRWRPGHTCIPQPTESDVRQLAAMSRALRLVGDMIAELSAEVGVAAPESWEAV